MHAFEGRALAAAGPPAWTQACRLRAHLTGEQVWRGLHMLLQRCSVQQHIAHVPAAGNSPANGIRGVTERGWAPCH